MREGDIPARHSTVTPQFASYDEYLRAEWALFSSNPARAASTLDAVQHIPVARVLDVGCGAGQELRPLLNDVRRFGIGIDTSPEVGRAGRALYASEQPGSHVAFVRGTAERLPFQTAAFDAVICRLALPYMDNARALEEIARVLRPGGVLILKFHHARFYLRELREALAAGRMRSAVHACRVLVAGSVYHVSGLQPRGRFTGGETYQTLWLLRRILAGHRLQIQRSLADSTRATPSVLAERLGA